MTISTPVAFSSVIAFWVLLAPAATFSAADWPMLGRDRTRNAATTEGNPPVFWSVAEGANIKWAGKLGTITWATPVVSQGLVWIGTTSEEYETAPGGHLFCFRETDGKLLYRHFTPVRPGSNRGWSNVGMTSSPFIEGHRVWFTTLRSEVICLDFEPLLRGEADVRELWKLDMAESLDVVPHLGFMGGPQMCSITGSRDYIYVITGNGRRVSWENNIYREEPADPKAPALLCLEKNSGKVVWRDNSPGTNTLMGDWGSPLVIEIDGQEQVIAGQGDGWLRGFDARTGESLWKFDMNPKEAMTPEQRQTARQSGRAVSDFQRNFFVNSPVFNDGKVYAATGGYIENGEGPARLVCIDPRKKGDLSLQRPDGGMNPNSGALWHFDKIGRTYGNPAIQDGLLIVTDFGGFTFCLDAQTGAEIWRHDLRAHSMTTALLAGKRIYVGDEDGDVTILNLGREKKVIAEMNMGEPIYGSFIFANNTLYLPLNTKLLAIHNAAPSWPQWRGPDRSNRSTETGLLASWPEGGPPLVWKAQGLGDAIASMAVEGSRVYTIGQTERDELLIALDSGTGNLIWATRLAPAVRQTPLMRWLSPRTPTVDAEHIYALGFNGDLLCVNRSDGQPVWKRSYTNDFGARRPSWDFTDYPLVDGDKLICRPGSSTATLVALNKRSGEVIWKFASEEEGTAGYGATIIVETAGLRQYVATFQKAHVAVNANDGSRAWRYPRVTGRYGSSYTPHIKGDLLLCLAGYGGGLAALKLQRTGDQINTTEVYHRPINFDPFQDCAVLVGEHLYSWSAGVGPICIDPQNGQIVWKSETATARQRSAVTYADKNLYFYRSDGTVSLVEASPKEYREKGQFAISKEQPAQGVTFPVVAGGRLYLRDGDKLYCYNVQADAFSKTPPAATTSSFDLAAIPISREDLPLTVKYRGPDAIFVATPDDVVETMLAMARLAKNEVVYDLGSGDGRILITAAKKHGAKAVGYEIDERLVELSRKNTADEGLSSRVQIKQQDLFSADLADADVVALYLPSPLLERLLPQFARLKVGARIISHQFEIPGVAPQQTHTMQSTVDGDVHRIFLWTVPLTKTAD